MLFYVPLESYPERYTFQLSSAEWGWMERNWIRAKVEYTRVDPVQHRIFPPMQSSNIETGVVLDAVRRPIWAMRQVEQLLSLAKQGKITDDDVIYFEDFWHPGIESLGYAFDQMGIDPKMCAYLWAQSVDEYDFTAKMRSWIRPFEIGTMALLDGVFVACPTLATLVDAKLGMGKVCKVHVVGLPFDSEEVRSRMPAASQAPKKNSVVFSSRWDKEKNPDFFLAVAADVLRHKPDTRFIICSSAPKLRSNDPQLLHLLDAYRSTYPNNIWVYDGLTKEEYYSQLWSAKIQFNCADQDWVSFTLLEAAVAGCYPIYPRFRSFPETFLNQGHYMYKHKDVESASKAVRAVLECDFWKWKDDDIQQRDWIYKRFDHTWLRMLKVMGVPYQVSDEEEELANKDPFQEKAWIQ